MNKSTKISAAAVVFSMLLLHAAPANSAAAVRHKTPARTIVRKDAARSLPQFLTGGDVSYLSAIEKLGGRYHYQGKTQDLLKMFKQHGCNCMRLRLWVNPNGKDGIINSLAYTIPLARRIKQDGFKLLLDIHYADTWADPGKQPKPAAWKDLPFNQLTNTVYRYSSDVIKAMRSQGAMPDIVQVGNEITGGMLWPDGKNWGPGGSFSRLGILLKAGIRGVKDGSGGHPPYIMIHIDRGGDWSGIKWFFDGIGKEGVQYDMIGLSYYPLYMDAPLSKVKENLAQTAAAYKKPIMIVETAYPWGGHWNKTNLQYPVTPAGQKQFVADLIKTVRQTPNGMGKGVIYWEPEWNAIKSLHSYFGHRTLFDNNWNALPALDALGQKTH